MHDLQLEVEPANRLGDQAVAPRARATWRTPRVDVLPADWAETGSSGSADSNSGFS